MRVHRRLAVLALSACGALTASLVVAPAAGATTATHPLGTKSLVQVLLADPKGFDHDDHDYDVLTAAVKAVLAAKPSSPVAVLADGTKPLTAFLPTDGAFRHLVKDLTGTTPASEQAVFSAVASLGVPTVEKVLLYHVVPGATITKKAALKADGARLRTASGGTITVDVHGRCHAVRVTLVDADRNDRDPAVVAFDVNTGNRQVAHGIDRVLRPFDLP